MALKQKPQRAPAYWPGFVDALSALLMIMIFLLSLFVLVQFLLSQEISGRDALIARLNEQLAGLGNLLNFETREKANLEVSLLALDDRVEDAQAENDKLASILASLDDDDKESAVLRIRKDILESERISEEVRQQIELYNLQLATLRRQIKTLNDILEATEAEISEDQTRISELGKRLNAALAQRLQELAQARSTFFARLRDILGNREGFEIVGDRFRLQSEVLFPAGSSSLTDDGRNAVNQLADVLNLVRNELPDDVPWVLRVDGHTDRDPINTPFFPTNWSLGGERAISVVLELQKRGVPPERLMAVSFAEFQPVNPAFSRAAYKENRRIEFKITQRLTLTAPPALNHKSASRA